MTKPNSDILRHYESHPAGLPGTIFGRDVKTISNNMRRILGDTVSMRRSMANGEMAMYSGVPQSTYGIPFDIDGTATVVEDTLSTNLSTRSDPIKNVFAMSVHPSKRAIFNRKWVKGAQALVVPERAPARTVSIGFDSREEILVRHAISLEQNIYLYLRPQSAQEDLELKLEAIQNEMHVSWVSITYDKSFQHGTNVVSALQRGNVLAGMEKDPVKRELEADRMYVEMFCGIVSKSSFPFENLAANIKKAGFYTPSTSTSHKPAVMLVPPGLCDLTKYTKPSKMLYYLAGTDAEDAKKTIPVAVHDSETYEYPGTNIKVMVHIPPLSYRTGSGTGNPQVEHNEMQTPTVFATYYIEKYPGIADAVDYTPPANQSVRAAPVILTDFDNQEWFTCPVIRTQYGATLLPDAAGAVMANAENHYIWWLRPQMATLNDSAIYSVAPGMPTGEMMYSYPSAHASSSQHVGQFILTLTVYFGAAVRNPENLMVINGIKFNGIMGGAGTRILDPTTQDTYNEDEHDLVPFITRTAPWDRAIWSDTDFQRQARTYNLYPAEYFTALRANRSLAGVSRVNDCPTVFYRGTTRLDGGLKPRAYNNGHLGRALDHPSKVGVIKGYQLYNETPSLIEA